MFDRLRKFMKGGYAVPAEKLQKAATEMYVELLALPKVSADFTTAEGAILCLEEAYRRRDIEAAVAAKDFRTEARFLMQKTGFGKILSDENIERLAKTLELSFRAHITAQWPNFHDLQSFFPKREPITSTIVAVTEVCRFPDGLFSQQEILAVQTNAGWRVLQSARKDVIEDSKIA